MYIRKMKKILLLENIHTVAQKIFENEKFQVQLEKKAFSPSDLALAIDFDYLGIRSKTHVDEAFFHKSSGLKALGAYCIGTNQVALKASEMAGVPVFNAPYSNTRSVAELILGEVIALSRGLVDRVMKAHRGDWDKSADGSNEVRGKTLGIVGYGHIGSQVSILAESLGLKVIFYDVIKKLPLGNAESKEGLSALLADADFVTIHVPETEQTKNLFSKNEFKKMKPGSFLLNASRGTVVVIDDLVTALKEKHLAGCAVDVFPEEPASNKDRFVSPLQGLPNVILTPHIGGSTAEAQLAIAHEVTESLLHFEKTGCTLGAVNFPQVNLPVPSEKNILRVMNVHRNEPGVLGEINSVVSKFGANIVAQALSTSEQVGYLIMDLQKAQQSEIVPSIAQLPRSIKTYSNIF